MKFRYVGGDPSDEELFNSIVEPSIILDEEMNTVPPELWDFFEASLTKVKYSISG
jgi:hypothetical protein